jgi:TonB family protein
VIDETAKPTETKTLHAPEPAPKATTKAPDKPADVKIPEKGAKKPKKPSETSPTAATPPRDAPDTNVIPGEGRPAPVQSGRPGGTGPASFGGDGTFGTRFGPYVSAMQRAIQDQWHDAISTIPRGSTKKVFVTFTIDRDGRVSNLEVAESSGSTQLDNSARKAVLTAKLQPLPRDYRGSTVDVRFTFDYSN